MNGMIYFENQKMEICGAEKCCPIGLVQEHHSACTTNWMAQLSPFHLGPRSRQYITILMVVSIPWRPRFLRVYRYQS